MGGERTFLLCKKLFPESCELLFLVLFHVYVSNQGKFGNVQEREKKRLEN
jgi:hypothetical protein